MNRINVTDFYNEQKHYYANCMLPYGQGPNWLLSTVLSIGFQNLNGQEFTQLEQLFKLALFNGATNLNDYVDHFIWRSFNKKQVPASVIFNNKELIFRDAATPLKIKVDHLNHGLWGEDLFSMRKFLLESGNNFAKGYLDHEVDIVFRECKVFKNLSLEECTKSIERIEVYKSHGTRCDDRDVKFNFIKASDLKHITCNVRDASTLWGTPSKVLKKSIPHVLHQIWLSNPDNPKDIKDSDLELMKVNHAKLHPTAHHIWTNIPHHNLPLKLLKLVNEGVVTIRHPEDALDMPAEVSKVYDLFSSGRKGIAVDLLRYYILSKLGGIYADLNFKFESNLSRELDFQDFIGLVHQGYPENFFIASKPEHPILKNVIHTVLGNIDNPPKYFDGIEFKKSLTDYTTYYPLGAAYYKFANQGNADILYPYSDFNQVPESQRANALNYNSFLLQICPSYDDNELTEIAKCSGEYYSKIPLVSKDHYSYLISMGIDPNIGTDSTEKTWLYD